jgi:hypothetical protein
VVLAGRKHGCGCEHADFHDTDRHEKDDTGDCRQEESRTEAELARIWRFENDWTGHASNQRDP